MEQENNTTERVVEEAISSEEAVAVDFTSLSCEEMAGKLKELMDKYPVGALKEVMEDLPELFESQYKAEYEAALAVFTADGDSADGFVYGDGVRERFHTLCKAYREKRVAESRQAEAEREENLKIKLGIIEELKALVQKEEIKGGTFREFRALQEKWRATGMVPQGEANGLWETYHLHVENFYNYVKIDKELRDLDWKRNLDDKTVLCEEAERLAESNDVAGAFKQLQLLHGRWKEIGPVAKEQSEAIWERFRAASGCIHEKYRRFFESLKEEQETSLRAKEELCVRAEAMAAEEHEKMSQWQAATQKVLDLQQEWRHAGTVPLKERGKIYRRFRAACDTFFERKRKFYTEWEAELERNLALKVALCERVEELKESTDWKATTDKMIACQKEWKKIGPAPRKHSNKVWARFRAACDAFFERKNEHLKGRSAEQEQNLELKKALIEEVKAFALSGNNEEDIEKLKEFQGRWGQIGFVPIKEKEAVQEEFRQVMNCWFDRLNLDEFDRDLERFRAKISSLDGGENREYKIVNEREKLVGKIRQLETDVHTWENNIGFISKSNKSEGLIRELNAKIEKTRQRLALLQEKLKALDEII